MSQSRQDGPLGRAARFALAWLADSLRWAPGMLFVGVGGAFLSTAWLAAPARLLLHRDLARYTAHAEGRASQPFWRFEVALDRLGDGWNWAAVTNAELCADFETRNDPRITTHLTLCGARRARTAPWGIAETLELAPGVPITWPRDERGLPVVEIRLSPGARPWLESRPAGFWPLTGQSEEARAAMPPAGNELDALLLEVDRPLEWLIRAWPASSEAGALPMAFDPATPELPLPVAVVDAGLATRPEWPMAVALALFGALAWVTGWGYALGGSSRLRVAAACIAPLVLLPWWGDRFERVLLWLEPRAGQVGAEMLHDLTEPLRLDVEPRGLDVLAGYDRIHWSVATSYYELLRGPFGPVRPQPAPADPDAALRAAVEQVTARMLAADDDTLLPLLARLRQDELVDRGQIGLLFLDGARRIALDPARGADVRRTAASFLWWLSVTPIEPRAAEPAYRTRVELWKELRQFPLDSAVENSVGSMLERLEAPRS
ncbi:MAG: hypothetical protein U0610_32430 [bacterium]